MKKWFLNLGNRSDDVVSTRIRIARNVKGYPFPSSMSDEQKYSLIQKVSDALFNSEFKDEFKFIDIKKLSEQEKFSMVERHLISLDFAKFDFSQALITNLDESVSIMINEEDHIRIQAFCSGFELEKALENAKRVENILKKSIEFSYDEDFGFLTECPTNVGTGIRASVMMHLPVLEQMSVLDKIFNSVSKFGLTVRGTFGEGTKTKSSLYQISNQVTLGLTESELVQNLKNVVNQILDKEKQAQTNLDSVELKDKLFRSYGELKYARLVSSSEMFSRLSDIRLAVSLGYLDVSISTLNELLFSLGSAGVSSMFNNCLDATKRDEKRAEIIRNAI